MISQTGFGGFYGNVEGEQLERKAQLLKSEGVKFIEESINEIKGLNFGSIIIEAECILDSEGLKPHLEPMKGFKFETTEGTSVPLTA